MVSSTHLRNMVPKCAIEELKTLEECRALLGDDAIDKVEEELELLSTATLLPKKTF